MSSTDLAHAGSSKHYSLINSKVLRLENILLFLWLIANLVIGAVTVPQYGLSIDETNNYRYAKYTLDAYPSLFGILYEPKYNESFDGHGPAFVTLASLPIRLIQSLFPNAVEFDLWHFSYFVTFLLTGLCLYWLTKRWFNTWTAWGILILFGTQPMLLGHAFINPKDIPFMFFFTLSIVLGFRLTDGLEKEEAFTSLKGTARALTSRFRGSDPQRRRKFIIYLTLALAVMLVLLVFSSQINSWIERIVVFFYTASPDSWAGKIFSSAASHASSITEKDYVTKTLRLFQRLERGMLIAGVLFFLAYFGLLTGNTTLPGFLRRSWTQRDRLGKAVTDLARSGRGVLHSSSLKIWFTDIFRAFRNPRLVLAGVVLGLATAVRAISPWVGLIVFLALFAKVRAKAWTMTIAYFLVAGIVTYLAWPRLWNAPILRYLEGLGVISNFSHYAGRVLFNGHFYGISDLPYSYLPVLLNIQFTELLLLCTYIGAGVLGWQLLRSRVRTDLLLYLGLGFVLPLAGLILLNVSLYHNLRQVLFLIPAMFMLAAFALDLAFNKLTRSWMRVLLIAILALPGIYASIKLYPYEYVYYNSLIGGPAGAQNRYELDYWRISLRETAVKLNELAPPESKVMVTRSAGIFDEYSRPDLFIDKATEDTLSPDNRFDYVVQVSRWDAWDLYPDAKVIYSIQRAGVNLATIKQLSP
ncbi:MAG TPA: hypothetical protein VHP14_26120 [Anaerolineales bacterium]|nr:hypothetical protein [Anaerolineales bacterium]